MLGEQAFLALMPLAKSERKRYHLGACLQFEAETKARLQPFLIKNGIELVEEVESELTDGIASAYRDSGWLGFLAGLQPLVDRWLLRFKEIAAAGPAKDMDTLQSMVTHEESFAVWIDKEIAGVEGFRKVFHDFRIGIQHAENGKVLFPPLPQYQAACCQF